MGKPFSECTLRELRDKAKTLKTIVIVMIVLMVAFVGFMIYQIVSGKEINVGVMIPCGVAIFGGMLPSLSALGGIKKEVEKRISK